jgi:hypothetical protein
MAEQLARQGSSVVVVELLEEIARDMETITRKMTLKRLETLPVEVQTRTRLVRLEDGEAFVVVGDEGEETSLGRFDSVLVSIGHRPHDPLSAELRAAGIAVEVLGDAREPGQVFDATQDGRRAIAAEVGTSVSPRSRTGSATRRLPTSKEDEPCLAETGQDRWDRDR